MNKYRTTLAGFGLLASLSAADSVHSADARTSATASIIAPTNVSTSASSAYTEVIFRNGTGSLSIRIPGAPARRSLAQSFCGWAMTGGGNNRCDAPWTLLVVNDGTLTGQQGVSLSLTRQSEASNVVIAMLAYN